MLTVGFHASHEPFTPRNLLKTIRLAEAAGFTCPMSQERIIDAFTEQVLPALR